MSTFNDLAVELQMAIWQFVLPYRGIHWVEIEGHPRDAPDVRETIRFTRQRCTDGNLPETLRDLWRLPLCDEQRKRNLEEHQFEGSRSHSGRFFQKLFPVTPSVYGAAGPANEHGDSQGAIHVAEEVAHTRRCRDLSTYTQVTTLLSTYRLSRSVALEYIHKFYPYSWWMYRSKGLNFRPRPLGLWEAQYLDCSEPDLGSPHFNLVPVIRTPLDLVVLRLHDQHGRATPLLHESLYQLSPDACVHGIIFPWFDRVAIEWHPRWATPGPDGGEQFCAAKVQAAITLMHSSADLTTMLYWLVDGVPRPNWKRDYPPVVPLVFEWFTASYCQRTYRNYRTTDNQMMDKNIQAAFLADCNLDIEFEANGRRYYVVFVVIAWNRWRRLPVTFMSIVDGPFIGGETIWPETIRAPARFVYDMVQSMSNSWRISFILSWEPI